MNKDLQNFLEEHVQHNIDNTVDYRRHLLKFGNSQGYCDDCAEPTCGDFQQYNRYNIPRYYSGFKGWFHKSFITPCPNKDFCVPEYKRIRFEEPSYQIVTSNEYSKHHIFSVLMSALLLLLVFIFSGIRLN